MSKKMLKMDLRGLQLFAEQGGDIGDTGGDTGVAGGDVVENSTDSSQPTFTPPQTQSEYDAAINKAVQTALANKTKDEQQRIDEAVKAALAKDKEYSQLSEDDRKKREFDDERQKFESERQAFEHEKLVVQIEKDLISKGLPSEFAELFAIQGAETALEHVKKFDKLFKDAVAEGIKASLRQKTPGSNSGVSTQENYGTRLAEKQATASGEIF